MSLQLRGWTESRQMDLQLLSDQLPPPGWDIQHTHTDHWSAEIDTQSLCPFLCLTGRRSELQERWVWGVSCFPARLERFLMVCVFSDDLFQKVVRSRSSRTMKQSQWTTSQGWEEDPPSDPQRQLSCSLPWVSPVRSKQATVTWLVELVCWSSINHVCFNDASFIMETSSTFNRLM